MQRGSPGPLAYPTGQSQSHKCPGPLHPHNPSGSRGTQTAASHRPPFPQPPSTPTPSPRQSSRSARRGKAQGCSRGGPGPLGLYVLLPPEARRDRAAETETAQISRPSQEAQRASPLAPGRPLPRLQSQRLAGRSPQHRDSYSPCRAAHGRLWMQTPGGPPLSAQRASGAGRGFGAGRAPRGGAGCGAGRVWAGLAARGGASGWPPGLQENKTPQFLISGTQARRCSPGRRGGDCLLLSRRLPNLPRSVGLEAKFLVILQVMPDSLDSMNTC